MSDPRDQGPEDVAARRYRSAVETVDERPSEATRAAILAAAARQVGAQPRAADAMPQQPARRRWPLAAAAAVMLSTLAVLLAVRTEREMPSFTAPVESASERMRDAAPAVPAAAPSASKAELRADGQTETGNKLAASSEPTVPSPSLPLARAPKVDRSVEGGVRSGVESPRRGSTDQSIDRGTSDQAANRTPGALSTTERSADARSAGVRIAPDVTEARSSLGKETLSPEPPPAQKAIEAPSSSAREQVAKPRAVSPALGSSGAAMREDEAAPRAREERDRQRAANAPVPATPGGLVSGFESKQEEFQRSATEWMKKIVELRTQGRNDEADLELRKFRERYPEIVVPAEAMSKAATR